MKKLFNRLLAILLSIIIILGIAPIEYITKLDWSNFFDWSFNAFAASEENAIIDSIEENISLDENIEIHPTFEQYKAKMMLGLKPGNIDISTEYNKAKLYFDYYINENIYSPCASFLDQCYEDNAFMAEVAAWKAYSLAGAPSSAVDLVMKHEDYCMALILEELDRTMSESSFTTLVKNKVINDSNSIIKQLCKSLNITSEAQLIDSYAAAWGSAAGDGSFNWTNLSDKEIKFWEDVVKKSGGTWLKIGNVTNVIGNVLKYSKGLFEVADKISMYGSLSDVDWYTRQWLLKMSELCPASDVAMKTALEKLYAASSNLTERTLVKVCECEQTAAEFIVKFFIDEGIKSLCVGNPVVAAVFAGFAAGRTLCNVFFNTDKKCEQFAILEWLFKLQDLSRQAVSYISSDFRSNPTQANANLFVTYVDYYFRSIIDVDVQCMMDFLELIYSSGLWNQIKSFFGATNDLEQAQEALEGIKKMRKDAYTALNDYVLEWYETEFPDNYGILFGDSLANQRIPITSLFAYISLKPDYYPNSVDMQIGDFRTVCTSYEPHNTTQTEIKITCDNEDVIQVHDLTIVAVGAGTANITVQSMYNSDIKSTFKVTVVERIEAPEEGSSGSYTPASYFNYSKHAVTINGEREYRISITGLNKNILTVKIPVKIDGYIVSSFSFRNNIVLKKVIIPNTFTIIGNDAFYGCSSLTSITIPNSVKYIGSSAFYGCSSLTSITIPNSVTSIGYQAFYGCSSLTSITIPNSVKYIDSSTFYGCGSLTNITIPDSVTSIGKYAFKHCSSLVSITIPDSVTNIDSDAFYGCPLKNVVMGNGLTAIPSTLINVDTLETFVIGNSVTIIGSTAFQGCSSLTSITIPNSVTSIGEYAFKHCSSLKNLYYNGNIKSWCNIDFIDVASYPNIDASNIYFEGNLVTEINIPTTVSEIDDYTFYNFKDVASVTISDSVTSIGKYAFKHCSSLASITIPNSVTIIGYDAFYGCSSLSSITIPDRVTSIGSSAFNGCPLKNVVMGNGLTAIPSTLINKETLETFIIGNSVTSIGYKAFYGCSSLTNITIPDSVTSIDDYAFYGCSSLASVTIGNSVTSIDDHAFYGCSSLASVTIGNSVTSIDDYAFYGCNSLTSITIPNSVTSMDNYAFYNCSSLTSITIPNSVTNIGRAAFYNCSSLKNLYYNGNIESWCNISFGKNSYSHPNDYASNIYFEGNLVTEINIPNTVSEIDDYTFNNFKDVASVTISDSVTSIGYHAFYNCSSLASITIPNNVTSIDWGAFNGCPLKNVVMGNGLTAIPSTLINKETLETFIIGNSVTSIGYQAFYGCSSLTSIVIPDRVTSIDSSAFYNCSSLTNVTIGNSVTSIGSHAFDGCSSLTSITIPDSVTSIENSAFSGCSNLISATIGNSVTSIGNSAFYNCSSLTSITIPDSVTSIGSLAFCNCSYVTSITIPDSVTSIGSSAFNGCPLKNVVMGSGLTAIPSTLINQDTLETFVIGNSVTSIDERAFKNCSRLTNITIPDSVTSIGSDAFYNCSSLTSITIPNSVTSIDSGAFYRCSSLKNLYYNGNIENWCNINFYNLYAHPNSYASNIYFEGNLVTEINIPKTVHEIDNYTFYNFKDVVSAIISDSVTSIGYQAFYGCSSLTSLTMPNSVTSIGYQAFYGCSSLTTSLTIPDSVTSIDWGAFSGCPLKNVVMGNGLTAIPSTLINKETLETFVIGNSVTSISSSAFNNCRSLTIITIPDSVTSIDHWAFENCSSLTNITIPNSVISIGSHAFDGCSSLTNVTIGNSVTSIGDDAFYNCSSLTSITIPNSVTSIGPWAFENCSNLTSVTIPDSVTSIDSGTFYNCSSLASITIPDSVTSIGSSAFSGCSSLTDIYYSGTKEQWESIDGFDSFDDSIVVHYNSQTDHVHNKQITVVKEATCSETGIKKVVCSCGLDVEVVIPKLPHNYVKLRTVDPTCTSSGYTEYECSVCKWTYTSDYKDALGHDFVNDECTRCGLTIHNIRFEDIMKLEIAESNQNAILRFIPEESGTYSFFSDSQHDTYGEIYDSEFNYLASNDDDGDENNFLISYDFEEGKTYYLGAKFLSSNTGSFYVGLTKNFVSCHSFIDETVDPTCMDEGYTRTYCTRCGYESECEYYDALGHDYVDGYCTRCSAQEDCHHPSTTVVGKTDPTCDEQGYTGDTVCTVCRETIEWGNWLPCHYLTKEFVKVVEPTCEEEGYTLYRCTVCGEEFNADWIEPTGHTKGELVRIVQPTCTDEGYSIYKCTVCGEEFQSDWVWSTGHTGEAVRTIEPTCTTQGYTLYKCSVCGKTYKDDYESALGHNYENGICTRCSNQPANLELNKYIQAKITSVGETVYFKFVPDSDGTYYFYSDSEDDTYGYIYDSEMNELAENDDYDEANFVVSYELESGKTYYFAARYYSSDRTGSFSVCVTDEFTSNHNYVFSKTIAPTCLSEGYDLYICSGCGQVHQENYTDSLGGSHNYENGVCTKCGEKQGITAISDSLTVIDVENKLIYGLKAKLNSEELFEKYTHYSDDLYYNCNYSLGTGSNIELYSQNTNDLYDTYTIVIFGDINGDGWYDGQDSFIVNCIANGMLTREQIGEAKWMAADCNHDGEINAADVAILEQAGLLLSEVDQTMSTDELMETQAYQEYINLIDQNPDEEPSPVDEPTEPEVKPQTLIDKIVEFVKYIISIVRSFIKF